MNFRRSSATAAGSITWLPVRQRINLVRFVETIRAFKVRSPQAEYASLIDDGESKPENIPLFLLINLARVYEFTRRVAWSFTHMRGEWLLTPDIDTRAVADSPAEQFANDGFAGPFPLGSPGQMSVVALILSRSVFTRPGPLANDPFVNRHLDSPMVAQLCTHPAIIAQVEPLLGPDLVVWRSLFFFKGPGSKEVSWHQDSHFWNLDPPITITAWLAIDRAQSEDHCMEIIPGSHRTALPHVPSAPGSQFPQTAEVGESDLLRAIELPVDAGMFVLFDQRLAHRSRPGGQNRRLALSVRIAPSCVKIDPSLLPDDGRVLPMRANSFSDLSAGAGRISPTGKRPPE